jgi:soluble lytic murein transglycosylase-like protein
MKFVLPITLVLSLSISLFVYRAKAEKTNLPAPSPANWTVSLPAPPVEAFAPAPVTEPVRSSAPPKANRQIPCKQRLPKTVDAHAMIRAAAARHGVPAAFVKSIVAAESNFNPSAVSPKGAVGLMQLMPQTAHQFGADPRVPAQNVDAGTRYLKFLMCKYSGYKNWLTCVIAAYNAGPGVVDRYRGVPPFPETRTYVSRVLAYLREFRKDPTLAVGGLRIPRQ